MKAKWQIGTVEPVFGNIRYDKRPNPFTLCVTAQGGGAVAALLPEAQH